VGIGDRKWSGMIGLLGGLVKILVDRSLIAVVKAAIVASRWLTALNSGANIAQNQVCGELIVVFCWGIHYRFG